MRRLFTVCERVALTQKSSVLCAPSPLVLTMMVLTNFKMSFSVRNIRKGVVVHTLGKVDSVENGNAVFCPLQKLSHFANQAAFGVSNDIRTVKLHDIGLAEKPCLSAARAADDKNILVSCAFSGPWGAWTSSAVPSASAAHCCQRQDQ